MSLSSRGSSQSSVWKTAPCVKPLFFFFLFFLFTATLHLQSGTASLNHDGLPFFFFFPPVLPPPPQSQASLPRLHPSVLKADEPSTQTQCGTISPGRRSGHADVTHNPSGRLEAPKAPRKINSLNVCVTNSLLFFYPLPPPRARRLS